MHFLPNLEMHVVHSCNLACESCSHYSNQGHKGIVSLEEGARWMQAWSARLAPGEFSLLGGEPTLHPHLPRFVELARRCWPRSRLRLVTNGFFLHRHPELPLVLRDDPAAVLCVSWHHDSPEYRERVRPVRELVADWVARYGIAVQHYEAYQYWSLRYHGFGAAMRPFDDRSPRTSWENCRARSFTQLQDGMLWKCAPLAYLPMQHAKYGLSQEWDPYLRYQPPGPECSDAQLGEFLARQDESVCGMCSARPPRLTLPLPLTPRSGVPPPFGKRGTAPG
jgi:hypothetical protein